MTPLPSKTNARQVRLGDVQLNVLRLLAICRASTDATGPGRAPGLTHREILAALHGYIVLGPSQWLPSVSAQVLRRRGRAQEGAAVLGDHAATVIAGARAALLGAVEAAQSPGDTAPSVERRLLLRSGLQTLERLDATILGLSALAANEATYKPWVFNALHDAAAQVMTVVHACGPHVTSQVTGRAPLRADAEEDAASTVRVHQASLSRALRLLREHALIVRGDVTPTPGEGGDDAAQERYAITAAGLSRLHVLDGHPQLEPVSPGSSV